MPIRRGLAARAALLAILLVSLIGCAKRSLSTGELRAVTAEVVAAAQRSTDHHAQIAIRPELEPTWYGGEGRLVADDVDISVESASQMGALGQAIAQIARRRHLSFTESSSPEGSRIELAFRGSRTHLVRVRLASGAALRAPAQGAAPGGGAARLAIIIDDLGGDRTAADTLLALPFPLTASVLPNLQFSTEVADEAYRRGDHVMLHLPMQAESESQPGAPAPEPVELRVGMSESQVKSILASMLATVPHAGGVNNHEGSRATSDPELMNEVMAAIRERGLYFIDSRTTASTVAYDAAESAGVPSASRKVFLDDIQTKDAILAQLELAARAARRDGSAIAIGHPRPTTIAALADGLPRLRSEGVQLVFASEMVH